MYSIINQIKIYFYVHQLQKQFSRYYLLFYYAYRFFFPLRLINLINLKFTIMSTFNTTNYRLYAKFNDQKTFKPLDIAQGTQVSNLIRATIVPAENLEKLKQLVELNRTVCHMQIRDLNNKIIF